jgi:AraC-like DNA-binding protein
MHSHALPSVSVVLSGQLTEQVKGSEAHILEGSLCVKPEDVRHSNAYGAEGATIVSIVVSDPTLWENVAPRHKWSWSLPDSHQLSPLLRLVRLGGPGVEVPVLELLSLVGGNKRRGGIPPLWLRRVRERFNDELSIGMIELARHADVHPVYLSRAFTAWYGVTPSIYRARRRTSLAISLAMNGNLAGSAIAQEAGFADQSHMLRSVKRFTGHRLSELRALHAKKGSVETLDATGNSLRSNGDGCRQPGK